MTHLRVIKGGEHAWAGIKIDKNVTISNRRENKGPLEYGEFEAKIQNGNVTTKRNGSGEEETLSFSRVSMSEKKHNVFMEICGLDGLRTNFTQEDAVLATQLSQEKLDELGIVKVVKDFAKGFVQIILGDGKNDVLTFDFETKQEKYNDRGSIKVKEDTNALDLGLELGVDPRDLIDANAELLETVSTKALKNYPASSEAVYQTYKTTEIDAGMELEVPLKYDDCWEDNYNK